MEFFVCWQCPCVYFEGFAVNIILLWIAFDQRQFLKVIIQKLLLFESLMQIEIN